MKHTFGLEIVEIGGEEFQDGYNGFREVVDGEILVGAARWDIFCHKADQSKSSDPYMDKPKPKPIKDL